MKSTTTVSSYISSNITVDATQWHKDGDHHSVLRKPPTNSLHPSSRYIHTQYGDRTVKSGDWIINNSDGTYSVCDQATFALVWQVNAPNVAAKKSIQSLIDLPLFSASTVAQSNEIAMTSAAEAIERMISHGVLVHVNGVRGYTFPAQSIIDAENATVTLRATMEAMNSQLQTDLITNQRSKFEQSLSDGDLSTTQDAWGSLVYCSNSVQDKWTGWQMATVTQ